MKTTVKVFFVFAFSLSAAGGLYAQQINLDETITRAASGVEEALPQGTKVAVLNFVSPAEAFSDYVIEELTGKLVTGRKITIVDRRNLALISQEMNLQLSGDVSDESAQEIGRMLGAQSIVSGTLTNMGTFYRFRVKVINVETAAIQTQVSFDMRNDAQVTFLLGESSSSGVAVNPPPGTPGTAAPVSTAPPASSVSFLEAAPSYDKSSAAIENVRVTGVQYRDALVLSTGYNGYSLHNLSGRYARITGLIGRVDGTSPVDSTVHFYGDGLLLRTFNLKATDLPVEFSLEITGVRQLRIEFGQHSSYPKYALVNTVVIPASGAAVPVSTAPPANSVSFLDAAPSYDRNSAAVENVRVGGVQYRDALVLSTGYNGYSLHNLSGRYARITGFIGRVDGTSPVDSTVNLYGDGILLRAFNLRATDLPVEFSLEITGVRQLKIEFGQHSSYPKYALVNTVVIPAAR